MIPAPRAYLDERTATGVVPRVGRTRTWDASTFGIVIFRAAAAEEARRVMTDAPAIRAGVMRGEGFPFGPTRMGAPLSAGA